MIEFEAEDENNCNICGDEQVVLRIPMTHFVVVEIRRKEKDIEAIFIK